MHEILWVCNTQPEAVSRKHLVGNPDNIYFVGVASMLGGRGFDEIIIEPWESGSEVEREYKETWIRDFLPTKLFPGGRIMTLAHLERPSMVPI